MATIPTTVAEIKPPASGEPDYEVNLVSLNQWQLAWRRFRRHRVALIGSILLLTIVGLAIVGPLIVPYNALNVPDPILFCPGTQTKAGSGCPPSLSPDFFRPFGTTGGLQLDLFALVMTGARLSLLIGIGASVISAVIGTVVGGIAGYFGGWIDGVLMRCCDVLLSLPILFVILVVANFIGEGRSDWWTIMLIFAVFGWAGLARLVRSVFLSLKGETFVDAARAVGVGDMRIIFRHILPNSVSPIIVATTLSVAAVIVGEAFVSYLGFGVNPLTPTWGNILTKAQNFLAQGNWWWTFFPGLFLVLTVLAVNFMGDGLRDALDPRARV